MLSFKKQLNESFILLEIAAKKTSGVLLVVDSERNLIPKKIWKNYSVKRMLRTPFLNLEKKQVIVSADPSLATTLSVPVDFARNADTALTLEELENFLSQTIGRLFVDCRREASRRLGKDELDTILVSAAARNFKVDGHGVLNPVGFKARTVNANLELSLTTREIFEELKELWNSREGIFFTETARAGLVSLLKLRTPPVNLIRFEEGATHLFILDTLKKGNAMYKEKLEWNVDNLFAAIAAELGVELAVAKTLYNRYVAGGLSDHATRFIAKTLNPAVELFGRTVEKARFAGYTYFDSPVPVDDVLGKRRGKVLFAQMSLAALLYKFGFATDPGRWHMPEKEILRHLMPFFEYHLSKSSLPVNQKMRRRLHWLVAEPAEDVRFS